MMNAYKLLCLKPYSLNYIFTANQYKINVLKHKYFVGCSR